MSRAWSCLHGLVGAWARSREFPLFVSSIMDTCQSPLYAISAHVVLSTCSLSHHPYLPIVLAPLLQPCSWNVSTTAFLQVIEYLAGIITQPTVFPLQSDFGTITLSQVVDSPPYLPSLHPNSRKSYVRVLKKLAFQPALPNGSRLAKSKTNSLKVGANQRYFSIDRHETDSGFLGQVTEITSHARSHP